MVTVIVQGRGNCIVPCSLQAQCEQCWVRPDTLMQEEFKRGGVCLLQSYNVLPGSNQSSVFYQSIPAETKHVLFREAVFFPKDKTMCYSGYFHPQSKTLWYNSRASDSRSDDVRSNQVKVKRFQPRRLITF